MIRFISTNIWIKNCYFCVFFAELSNLIAKIRGGKLKEFNIQAELYKAPSSIHAQCIDPSLCKKEIISMYFESSRSGGGRVKDVQLLGNGEAIITFEDPTGTKLGKIHTSYS